MKKKSIEERAIRINLTLDQKSLEKFDRNIEEFQKILIAAGGDETEVKRKVSRSSMLREFIQLLSNNAGFDLMKATLSLSLGLSDKQINLFDSL
ncbi:MAG: hypothetical protein MJ196_13060 [Treponemataceae bacterium]|nr:hypothetical protein [Treponemataceae bacterium]